MTEEISTIQEKKNEPVVFKGKYISTIGRRKTSVARVRMYKKGVGAIIVNDMRASEYFPQNIASIIKQPLKLTSHLRDMNFSVTVKGGGKKGQADAIRHGITRALMEDEIELRPTLKSKGWVTRDPRKKERKKPGLKKARRAPQWAKR
jgi:small subunit ribosomal protein S9